MRKLIEKLKRLWRSQQSWTDIVEDEEGNLFLLTPKGEVVKIPKEARK